MAAFCGGSGFWTFHKCGHLIRNCVSLCVPVKSNSTYKYRRSTSLQLVRKKKRDSERMSTFMKKKDAQNLPFHELDTDELQKLSFNSLSRMSDKCYSYFKKSLVSLETTVNSQTACISFLKVHNNDLKVSAVVNSDKCDKLSREVDRLTETNKRLVKLKEKHLEELDRAQLKRMKNQNCIDNLQLECQNKESMIINLTRRVEEYQDQINLFNDELEHTRQKEINKTELLEQQLETVKSDLEEEKGETSFLRTVFKGIIDSARKEMEFMSTQLDFCRVKTDFRTFRINKPNDCNRCGSQYHRTTPGAQCKLGHEYSRYYKTKCGSCGMPGHFTIMCHHLKKLL